MDYGFPFHTTKLSKLIPIPEVLKHPGSKIFAAGLAAMPVAISFDHIKVQMQGKIGEVWTDRAVRTFEKCIREAKNIYFVPSTKVSHDQVLIGDLNLTDARSNSFIQMTKFLSNMDLAVVPPYVEFAKCYKKLLTQNTERWNDYRRAGGVLKQPPDVMLSPVTLELTGDSDGSSTINESYQQSVDRKVRDWQSHNDYCNSSDLGSDVGSPTPSVTTYLNENLQPKIDQILATTKMNIERITSKSNIERIMKNVATSKPEEKTSTSSSQKQANEPVFLAAGAAYGEAKNHRAKNLTNSKDDFGSLEEFVSVSQVGSVKQESFN